MIKPHRRTHTCTQNLVKHGLNNFNNLALRLKKLELSTFSLVMSAVVVEAVALLCECLCVFPVDVVDRLAAVVIGKAWESIEREKKRPRDYLTVCCHPDGTTSPPPPALM